MKKRDFKAACKDVRKLAYAGLDSKGKRVSDNATGALKIPYKMYMGMNKKSLDRARQRSSEDRAGRVVGESSRQKKLMQNYFEEKETDRKEEKRLRLDISNRGLNWHQMSLGRYKNGALHFSRDALARMEKGDLLGGAFKAAPKQRTATMEGGQVKMGQTGAEKKKRSYSEIVQEREQNSEFMTGKRFAKSRGAMGKLHKKKRK